MSDATVAKTDNPLLTKLKADLTEVQGKLGNYDALKAEERYLKVAINALEKRSGTRTPSDKPRKNPWAAMTPEQKKARVDLMNKARKSKKPATK